MILVEFLLRDAAMADVERPCPFTGLIRRRLREKRVEIRYLVDLADGSPILWEAMPHSLAWRGRYSGKSLPICFPIAPEHASLALLREGVRVFGRTEGLDVTLLDKAVQLHYGQIENRMLIRPIGALLQISPSALRTFEGNWEPYESESMTSGRPIEMVEHLVYRLVFDTIGDLAASRNVPADCGVIRATVRPEESLAQRHEPPLLELLLKDGSIIGFDAGFDTDHEYYQGEDDCPEEISEFSRNPENCWVRIWWDHRGPNWREAGLEGTIGYSFEDSELLRRFVEEAKVPGTKTRRPTLFKRAAALGDAILGAYVTAELLRRLSGATARQLHDLRVQIVRNEALAELARKLDFRVTVDSPPGGAGHSGFQETETGMLGDTLEALLGLAYMDGGLKAAQTVARRVLRDFLDQAAPNRFLSRQGSRGVGRSSRPPREAG